MKYLKIIIVSVICIAMCICFASCGCSDKDIENGTETSNMSQEELAKKAEELNADAENFYGTWKATSSNAYNLYGHLEITINDDGTFNADVTDIKFDGTWEKIEGGIQYESVYMNGKIFYGKKCRMVIEDQDVCVTMVKVE